MTSSLRVAIAQLNITVGDFPATIKKHIAAAETARSQGAEVIVFPECSITGYPAEDCLLRADFLTATQHALQKLISHIKDIYCLVGHPTKRKNHCYNTATLFYNGEIITQYDKHQLPNYGVFDEYRYFTPGSASTLVNIKGIPVGILICEDIWHETMLQEIAAKGAKLLLVPNASPFEINKHEERLTLLKTAAKKHAIDIIYTNLVGGQDELVFDGGSMAINHQGQLHAVLPFFKESIETIDFNKTMTVTDAPSLMSRTYDALSLAVHDYINKNNIPGALIGLSGGIDSALTLAIAVDALGAERVHAVMMPSQHTADISKTDAALIAQNLAVRYDVVPIIDCYQSFIHALDPLLSNTAPSVTYENLQARARGVILMALSNSTNKIVLNTGNRSELATGYCTLYGDMVGGFSVLKDVPKTMVYELAHYRNTISNVIPESIILRAPTAELAPNQKDEDSLPPYSILDAILELYLTKLSSKEDIIAAGFDKYLVEKVILLVHRNEYKRKQAAIGPHLNHRSFGKDWRFPLTNKWISS